MARSQSGRLRAPGHRVLWWVQWVLAGPSAAVSAAVFDLAPPASARDEAYESFSRPKGYAHTNLVSFEDLVGGSSDPDTLFTCARRHQDARRPPRYPYLRAAAAPATPLALSDVGIGMNVAAAWILPFASSFGSAAPIRPRKLAPPSAPCCDPKWNSTSHPEHGRERKCYMRGLRGQCRPVHKQYCPAGCGHCEVCDGHPLRQHFERIREQVAREDVAYVEPVLSVTAAAVAAAATASARRNAPSVDALARRACSDGDALACSRLTWMADTSGRALEVLLLADCALLCDGETGEMAAAAAEGTARTNGTTRLAARRWLPSNRRVPRAQTAAGAGGGRRQPKGYERGGDQPSWRARGCRARSRHYLHDTPFEFGAVTPWLRPRPLHSTLIMRCYWGRCASLRRIQRRALVAGQPS